MATNTELILQSVLLAAKLITEIDAPPSLSLQRLLSGKGRQRRKRLALLEGLDERRKLMKASKYIAKVKRLPDDTFCTQFKMSRTLINLLLEKVAPQLNLRVSGRDHADPMTSLLLTLWTLTNCNVYSEIADRFSVARGAAHDIFLRTCKAICNLCGEYIKWPNKTELTKIIDDFNVLHGQESFPNVVGVVGAMQIEIPKPMDDPLSYVNKKRAHSMNLQAICDSKMRFMDVFFGWPGSTSNAGVWDMSPIGEALENNRMQLPHNAHIIGDRSYPLRSFLLVPYKYSNTLTAKQHVYNTCLRSTRAIIKKTFSRLKGKFKRLRYLNMRKLTVTKDVVIAACVLHNFVITHGEEEQNCDYDSDNGSSDSESDSDDEYLKSGREQDVLKRDSISDLF